MLFLRPANSSAFENGGVCWIQSILFHRPLSQKHRSRRGFGSLHSRYHAVGRRQGSPPATSWTSTRSLMVDSNASTGSCHASTTRESIPCSVRLPLVVSLEVVWRLGKWLVSGVHMWDQWERQGGRPCAHQNAITSISQPWMPCARLPDK